MFCYISSGCIGADGPECSIFLPVGVKIRNKRCSCNFKEMRVHKESKGGKKVNPLKASKRGK
jgi:hypothetical protein